MHSLSPVRSFDFVAHHPAALSFLVAEDDDELRFVIVYLLQEAFPQAAVAAYPNGRDALRDFDARGATLVVSNHSMPVMNGPTFVHQLRRRSSSLPILMVSGSPEARQEGRAAGISCFLDKSELHSSLVAAVRSLLEDPAACCTDLPGVAQRSDR